MNKGKYVASGDKRYPVRDLHSKKNPQPRIFDIVKLRGQLYLEMKSGREKSNILLDDVLSQVQVARETL